MQQLLGLVLSIGVEATVVAFAARRLEADRLRLALVAVGATLLTHPFAWHGALAGYAYAPVPVVVIGVELAVIATEALAYRWVGRLSWRRALLASLLANAVSTAVGFLSW
ncbi:MAG: hypothetical protein JKY65_12450 [Planctomycetes bacterium]|nr:hypothetical protein [Planctomycetota bacterium]